MSGAHISDAEIKKLHQPKSGGKEKGCLTRHQRRKRGHKCSHQWEAKNKARDHSVMYDYPRYQDFCGDGEFETAARETKKMNQFPRDYGREVGGKFMKNKPTHKGKEWNVRKKGNFDHFIKPYWHNAHHIVPNGSLKASINKTGKGDSRLPNLIKQGLLRAQYNLNGKINMVILPQGRTVAKELCLPRHLKGDEVGPDQKPEFFSHQDYSDKVEEKLDDVMRGYKKLFTDYLTEDHPPPPDKLSKDKIDTLSDDIFMEIKNLSSDMAGEALSQIPGLVK